MKEISFAFLTLLLVFACNKSKLPKGILSEDKMVAILIDIHIAEAKVNVLGGYSSDTTSTAYKLLEDKIFKKHKTKKLVYKKSYGYYIDHPTLMDKMYARVVDSLSLRQKLLKL